VQQPASQRDGDGVGAIVRAELVDQVLDVEVDGGLRNPQFIGDLFIAMPSPDLVPPPCGFLQVGSRFDVQ